MAEEKLKLVEHWSELRPGMLIVVSPCDECGGRHRHMLLRSKPLHGEPAFDIAPRPSCRDSNVLTSFAVTMRAVFKVVDGLDAPTETRVQDRKLERTR